jgi:hypothetical protein
MPKKLWFTMPQNQDANHATVEALFIGVILLTDALMDYLWSKGILTENNTRKPCEVWRRLHQCQFANFKYMIMKTQSKRITGKFIIDSALWLICVLCGVGVIFISGQSFQTLV